LTEDVEGDEFPDFGKAFKEAVEAARKTLSARLLKGEAIGVESFEISEVWGNKLITLRLGPH
jgi:hypothetical protein